MGFLILRTSAAAVETFDYYIGPSGSDSNDGLTTGTPWAITALRDKTSTIAGKRIGLLDGTYNLNSYATGGNDGGLDITAANVTVEAVNARQAIFTTNNGGSYPNTTSPAIHVRGNGVSLKKIRWQEFSWDPLNINAKDALVEDCDFYDVNHNRIAGSPDNVGFIFTGEQTVTGESYAGSGSVTIRNCRFEHVRSGGGAVSNDNNCGIGPLYRTRDWTIEDCSFYDSGHAIGWKNDNHGGLIVRRCYFSSTLVLDAIHGLGSDETVGNPHIAENCVFNNPSYSIDEWDPGSSKTSAVTKVRNNTFLTTSSSDGNSVSVIAHEICTNALPSGDYNESEFYNNIIYRRSGSAAMFLIYPGATPAQRYGIIDFNMYPNGASVIARDSAANGGATYSLSQWRTHLNGAGVTGQEANSSQASTPTFVDVDGDTPEDFQLAGGSAGEGFGRVGGVSGGAAIDAGAWGNGVTSIGCDF